MAIELKIPAIGESITEVGIGGWLKNKGDVVQKDEPIVTLESEKATVDLPAPEAGTLSEILKKNGDSAAIGEVIALIEKDGQKTAPSKAEAGKPSPEPRPQQASTVSKQPDGTPPKTSEQAKSGVSGISGAET